MPTALLPERVVVSVTGEDARAFLHNLLTCDVEALTPETPGFGALLTPQGKIIADMGVVALPDEDGGGFLLDVNAGPAPELMRKLTLFKLRSKVVIAERSPALAVLAIWGGGSVPAGDAVLYADPRLPALGQRAILPAAEAAALATAPASAFHARRIALGVPDGGKDFAYGDAYPHEALMDQLHGVSFTKGCYVGQEVVSRMQHRGTARTRIVPVRFEHGFAPEWGVEAEAGGVPLGRVGSCADGRGLALLRLDRVAEALAAGRTLRGGGLAFMPERESWMTFDVPGAAGPAA
jgi:tRNA-modifying protein YgfZ